MTWVPGKSGNPKGRPSGRIKKATQEVIVKLVGRDLPPSEMAVAGLRRLFDIGFDPATPLHIQVQALLGAMPYLAPRLAVVAQTVTHRADFSDCRTTEKLFERLRRTLAVTGRSCSGRLWPLIIPRPSSMRR